MSNHLKLAPYPAQATESAQVDWLIEAFASCFFDRSTILIRSHEVTKHGEPEYIPATANDPAKICFANGFFASALHEISHWCIAGSHRRTLTDFGYWYEPDGRDAAKQAAFETVEVKPQAIEWLFSLACYKPFRISADNVSANHTLDLTNFKQSVLIQARRYFSSEDKLPPDAARWFAFLQAAIRPNQIVCINELNVDMT